VLLSLSLSLSLSEAGPWAFFSSTIVGSFDRLWYLRCARSEVHACSLIFEDLSEFFWAEFWCFLLQILDLKLSSILYREIFRFCGRKFSSSLLVFWREFCFVFFLTFGIRFSAVIFYADVCFIDFTGLRFLKNRRTSPVHSRSSSCLF
jgi:hypothetical protein